MLWLATFLKLIAAKIRMNDNCNLFGVSFESTANVVKAKILSRFCNIMDTAIYIQPLIVDICHTITLLLFWLNCLSNIYIYFEEKSKYISEYISIRLSMHNVLKLLINTNQETLRNLEINCITCFEKRDTVLCLCLSQRLLL